MSKITHKDHGLDVETLRRLVINIANSNGLPIADDTRIFMEHICGIEKMSKMLLSTPFSDKTRYEPIFISKPK